MKYYVTMTDKSMSGWGMAKNKTNKLIIECDSYEDAELIERNAMRRSEMKCVTICRKKPHYGANISESWKTFEDMGGSWTKN